MTFFEALLNSWFFDFPVVFNFHLQNFISPYRLTWNTAPKALNETVSADSRVIQWLDDLKKGRTKY